MPPSSSRSAAAVHRPPPAHLPSASSQETDAAHLPRSRAGLIPRPCSRPFAAATRLPPPAALPPVFSGGRAPSSCRCPAADLSTNPKILCCWAGSGAPRIHVPASPSTPSAACTRHDTSCLPTSSPTPPSPQPHIAPVGIRRAVQPRPYVQSLLVCSLDSRAKSAPKSAERATDILCLKFSCTMETPLETLACDVLTSCRSRSLRVAGRALYPSASSPAP